jgi:hypothetical protein
MIMKLWTSLAAAGVLAGSAFANTTTTTPSNSTFMGSGKWKINVGLGLPDGDHSDAGVDTMFMVGADWMFGPMSGYANIEQFVGILGAFGEGTGSFQSTTYGIHYGILFALNQMGGGNWKIKAQGGYYNTKIDLGSVDVDDWNFGGLASIVYTPNGSQFSFEGGYYFFPENSFATDGSSSKINNRGWFLMLGIPVK